jgi:hypothetical protein
LAVTLLVSYHAYLHDFALLLLPCILTADYLSQTGWTLRHAGLAAMIGAFYVIPVEPTSMKTTATQMFSAVLLFAVLLSIELSTTSREVRL